MTFRSCLELGLAQLVYSSTFITTATTAAAAAAAAAATADAPLLHSQERWGARHRRPTVEPV
jgi:hypothetical protein